MATWLAIIGSLGGLVSLAVWALRAYVARTNQAAVGQERQAGRDAQQSEALNAENTRNQRAADAGDAAAAGGVSDWAKDPDNRARK